MNNNLIINLFKSNKNFMIGKIGATEAKAIIYPLLPKIIKLLIKKIIFKRMLVWSGFFPVSDESIEKFSSLYKKDICNIDILVSWRFEEKFISETKKIKEKIKLRDLEPYYSNNPWTKYLEKKRVLIIHPFEKTIISQYKKRKNIFLNQNILPEFDIDTIKAVQSLSSEDNRFKSWFDALEYMKDKISKKDFDIALIGCGAYGLPLASHVKKMGKIGIHMGGSLQLLFGIKGKRWDDNPIIKKLYNNHWVRPSEIEKPKNYKKVEEGCYW